MTVSPHFYNFTYTYTEYHLPFYCQVIHSAKVLLKFVTVVFQPYYFEKPCLIRFNLGKRSFHGIFQAMEFRVEWTLKTVWKLRTMQKWDLLWS